MRGDQLARQWRIIRAAEASSRALAKTEAPKRKFFLYNLEAPQKAGFPLYTEKVERDLQRAFIDAFKFKIFPSLSLAELRFYVSTAFPTKGLKRIASYG